MWKIKRKREISQQKQTMKEREVLYSEMRGVNVESVLIAQWCFINEIVQMSPQNE
jgi:hypothetical protein